jgi:hypothetical protein
LVAAIAGDQVFLLRKTSTNRDFATGDPLETGVLEVSFDAMPLEG